MNKLHRIAIVLTGIFLVLSTTSIGVWANCPKPTPTPDPTPIQPTVVQPTATPDGSNTEIKLTPVMSTNTPANTPTSTPTLTPVPTHTRVPTTTPMPTVTPATSTPVVTVSSPTPVQTRVGRMGDGEDTPMSDTNVVWILPETGGVEITARTILWAMVVLALGISALLLSFIHGPDEKKGDRR